jgi:atypical dual specificity phosphatase
MCYPDVDSVVCAPAPVPVETTTQWRQLDSWAEKHAWSLHQLLGDRRYILYGEWCYAKHSIHYARLPDLFLAFDIYDKSQG